jgi:serine/threonine-protein kinase
MQQLSDASTNTVALSPDGKSLVYASNRQLYLRSMDSLDANPIPGTEGAESPFFSPDGQWIAFFAEGKLQKVSINGGPPLFLSDTTGYMASWGPNDIIVFSPGPSANLLQVSASGGIPQPLTARDFANGEVAHVSPEILPDGKAFVFTAWRSNGDQIVVQDFETGERRVLIQDGTSAHYVTTGHLVYVREGTLLAVPFDLARLEVTGAPVPLIEGIMQGRGSRHAAFSVSGSGSLVYVLGNGMAEGALVWVHRTGEVEPLLTPPRRFNSARLSPDGQRIALGIEFDIWVYDIARDTLTRLTFEGTNNAPVWTSDDALITEEVAFDDLPAALPRLLAPGAEGIATAIRY